MAEMTKTKPCHFCKLDAPTIFDADNIFYKWAYRNMIINPDRSRFEGVRERLKWAALDETEYGCHPECALEWAVREEGYMERYGKGITYR